MKKINWGSGITIVIVLFLVITIAQVLIIHNFVDYDLVEEEYYAAEIKYQSQIEKIKRARDLSEPLKVKLSEDIIEFEFPTIFKSNKVVGSIYFYKPSDDLLDKSLRIQLNENNKASFPTKDLASGLWKVKIDWEVDGVTYFNEEFLMVP
jgi:hypothetical protein